MGEIQTNDQIRSQRTGLGTGNGHATGPEIRRRLKRRRNEEHDLLPVM